MRLPAFLQRWFDAHPEDAKDEHDGPWWTGNTECWYCGHECVSVVPIEEGQDQPTKGQECSKCGVFAMYPVEPKGNPPKRRRW